MGVRNTSGQFVVEAILIIVIFFGVTVFIAGQFKQNQVVASLISGPWRNLSGILQNGIWAPPNASMSRHPNNQSRHVSFRGEDDK